MIFLDFKERLFTKWWAHEAQTLYYECLAVDTGARAKDMEIPKQNLP